MCGTAEAVPALPANHLFTTAAGCTRLLQTSIALEPQRRQTTAIVQVPVQVRMALPAADPPDNGPAYGGATYPEHYV